MQIHTCRLFTAFSSPDLHFCGRLEDTGAPEGNPGKQNDAAVCAMPFPAQPLVSCR